MNNDLEMGSIERTGVRESEGKNWMLAEAPSPVFSTKLKRIVKFGDILSKEKYVVSEVYVGVS
jgi:hypothetical protein